MKHLLVLLVALFTLPALASNPGEPLDCSDWVFSVPGLSCSTYMNSCDEINGVNWCIQPYQMAFDNLGYSYGLVATDTDVCEFQEMRRLGLLRRSPTGLIESVGVIEERCSAGAIDRIELSRPMFDPMAGKLFLLVRTRCDISGIPCTTYPDKDWVMAISGFATTFDVLQSFTPTASDLGFRVPIMPEGFQHADYFDTYYGDLATVGDWSQAEPLRCGFPATTPTVGDYLTVADALPVLAPGQGRYYVTAANYMGQRRYGRKSSGGVLTGRDPGKLPICE